MNEFAGYAHPIRGGWWAMTRFARDGKPKPILGDGGAPLVFPNELEAIRAVNKHLLAYFNGDYQRDGTKLAARSDAEAMFNLPVIRSKGKRVLVERKSA